MNQAPHVAIYLLHWNIHVCDACSFVMTQIPNGQHVCGVWFMSLRHVLSKGTTLCLC